MLRPPLFSPRVSAERCGPSVRQRSAPDLFAPYKREEKKERTLIQGAVDARLRHIKILCNENHFRSLKEKTKSKIPTIVVRCPRTSEAEMSQKARRMPHYETQSLTGEDVRLLSLPQTALHAVLCSLDAVSLARIAATNTAFTVRHPLSRLPLVEHIAKQKMLSLCNGNMQVATRFR